MPCGDLEFSKFCDFMIENTRPFSDISPHLEDIGDDVIKREDTHLYSDNFYDYYSDDDDIDENRFDYDDVGGYDISGRGRVYDSSCGKRKHVYSARGGKPRHTNMSCKTQGCPKCFRLWAKRLAKTSARFLLGCAVEERTQLYHWTYSPKNKNFRGFESLERDLFEFMAAFGFTKRNAIVSIVRHPRKLKCAVCPFGDPKDSNCFKCDLGKGVKKVWHFLPHLHVITNFFVQEGLMPYFVSWEKEKGVIFKNITFEKRDWLDRVVNNETPYQRLTRIMAYEFGHALYEKGKQHQVVRYFGRCSKDKYRLVDLDPVKTFITSEIVQDDGSIVERVLYQVDSVWWDDTPNGGYRLHKDYSWKVNENHPDYHRLNLGEKFPYGTKLEKYAIPLTETDYPILPGDLVVQKLYEDLPDIIVPRFHKKNGRPLKPKIIHRRLRIVPPINFEPLIENGPLREVICDVPIDRCSERTRKVIRYVKNYDFKSLRFKLGYLDLTRNKLYKSEEDYFNRKRIESKVVTLERGILRDMREVSKNKEGTCIAQGATTWNCKWRESVMYFTSRLSYGQTTLG